MEFKFQQLKTPPEPNRGYIVLQSDDGYITDYTHWFQLFLKKNKEYNSWAKNIVPFNPAVNTSRINNKGGMKTEHLKEISRCGGEIVSHGRYHMGFLPHSIANNVSSGDATFEITDVGRMFGLPQTYVIDDGTNSEVITVVSRVNATSSQSGNITLQSPLVNSYTAGTSLRATEETMMYEWNQAVSDLANWGFECKNHVWPYNQNDEYMRSLASPLFNSIRGSEYPPINEKGVNLYNLKGYNLNALDNQEIDELLDQLIEKDAVSILYGHAESSDEAMGILEYLIDESIARGVKFITHQEAYELLK